MNTVLLEKILYPQYLKKNGGLYSPVFLLRLDPCKFHQSDVVWITRAPGLVLRVWSARPAKLLEITSHTSQLRRYYYHSGDSRQN